MRAVTIEGNYAPRIYGDKMCNNRSEARGETLPFLRDYADGLAYQLAEIIDVRFRAHDCDFDVAQRPCKPQGVFKKTAVELSDRLRREVASQTGLNRTWPWCLRHNHQYAVATGRA